ncbi:MAG TPA: OsmC family protein [Hypericibacter adhaerens]|jgi:organic hydroperoxide reductase OsmC/OhrA|uniref:Oxidoreductase n=1 Tax=Hypericibacter adhaerens TaxID=2602016 RepID=A0A5J6MWW1_9PROT|nr:OsmC family protein [Hypericibacter adhaerens]QEX22148.1 oxidoreductase [Hypericibacter adhaerens]HWA43254.1 OsmC family protein [Hypericibacter adhaerens]
MTDMTIKLRGIPDTKACVGWAGGHSVVVDRPEGKAGGQGLGFNGGQLLGLALGGCFCNDLYYVAEEMGIALTAVAVDVTVTFEGKPLLATAAALAVSIEAADKNADLDLLLGRAGAVSTVANSVTQGFPVRVSAART